MSEVSATLVSQLINHICCSALNIQSKWVKNEPHESSNNIGKKTSTSYIMHTNNAIPHVYLRIIYKTYSNKISRKYLLIFWIFHCRQTENNFRTPIHIYQKKKKKKQQRVFTTWKMKKSFAIIHFHLWFLYSSRFTFPYTMFRYTISLRQHTTSFPFPKNHISLPFFWECGMCECGFKRFLLLLPYFRYLYLYNTQIVGTFNNT